MKSVLTISVQPMGERSRILYCGEGRIEGWREQVRNPSYDQYQLQELVPIGNGDGQAPFALVIRQTCASKINDYEIDPNQVKNVGVGLDRKTLAGLREILDGNY